MTMALKKYWNIYQYFEFYIIFPTELNYQELMFCTHFTIVYFYKRNVIRQQKHLQTL